MSSARRWRERRWLSRMRRVDEVEGEGLGGGMVEELLQLSGDFIDF